MMGNKNLRVLSLILSILLSSKAMLSFKNLAGRTQSRISRSISIGQRFNDYSTGVFLTGIPADGIPLTHKFNQLHPNANKQLRCHQQQSLSMLSFSNEETSQLPTAKQAANKDDKEKKYTKSNLPSKICCVCKRPFDWRKKWEKVWDEVKYCSERCRRAKGGNSNSPAMTPRASRGSLSSTTNIPRPIEASSQIFRRSFFTAAALAMIQSTTVRVPAARASAKQFSNRPSKQEVVNVFQSFNSPEDFDPFDPLNDFRRLDESADSEFYKSTRFVEHIDPPAVLALTRFHDQQIKEFQRIKTSTQPNNSPAVDVLDVCSSWVSHISQDTPTRRVSGIGMNEVELKENKKLTDFVVQDLNVNSKLPYSSDSFDIVLLQLSIDYLIKPIEVLQEISRVLRDNGVAYISFSNRLFIQKAVAVWTSASDLEHLEIVGRYLHFATTGSTTGTGNGNGSCNCVEEDGTCTCSKGGAYRGFEMKPIAIDLSPSANSDPMYVVKACVKGCGKDYCNH